MELISQICSKMMMSLFKKLCLAVVQWISSKKNNSRKRTKIFSKDEDLLLISAYLNTALDPIIGKLEPLKYGC